MATFLRRTTAPSRYTKTALGLSRYNAGSIHRVPSRSDRDPQGLSCQASMPVAVHSQHLFVHLHRRAIRPKQPKRLKQFRVDLSGTQNQAFDFRIALRARFAFNTRPKCRLRVCSHSVPKPQERMTRPRSNSPKRTKPA